MAVKILIKRKIKYACIRNFASSFFHFDQPGLDRLISNSQQCDGGGITKPWQGGASGINIQYPVFSLDLRTVGVAADYRIVCG